MQLFTNNFYTPVIGHLFIFSLKTCKQMVPICTQFCEKFLDQYLVERSWHCVKHRVESGVWGVESGVWGLAWGLESRVWGLLCITF